MVDRPSIRDAPVVYLKGKPRSPLTQKSGVSASGQRGGRCRAHLPRERVAHPVSGACCGGSALRKIGEDVTGMLEHELASWKSLPPRRRG